MNTLRAKITTLVVAAILIVIGLAVWLTFATLPMVPVAFNRFVQIDSYHLSIILAAAKDSSDEKVAAIFTEETGRFGLRPEPAGGDVLPETTDYLRTAFEQRNITTPVVVTRMPEIFWPVASIAVPGRGWLIIPISLPPPPGEVLPFLFGGMLLLAAGVALVAIAVVNRLMRPLALIEKTVAKINVNGELPMLPENGPADIRATACAINLLASRLRCAMESRMRLVAAAGHDLRTPMTRMRLRAEFLDDCDRAKWLADIDELDHIADSAIRLVHEEIEDDKGEALRLDRLVNDLITELQELRLNVRAMEMAPVQVTGKPLALKRAIRNLLINAATHGGGASVSIRHDCRSVFVHIVDDGPGIPEALLVRAFEPFFRVDPARSSTTGAGLGLAIAKEIILRHRGSLILANRASGGLIQTLEVPATTGSV